MVFDPVAAYKSITTVASHPISALERIFQSMPSQIRSLRVAYTLTNIGIPTPKFDWEPTQILRNGLL